VASADGIRFVAPSSAIHAGPNPKYFGAGRGITYYNLVSDQFTGLNAVVVPGTLRATVCLSWGCSSTRRPISSRPKS
jgi:TnpA family transposase